ncbi:MAG: hypothetical protein WA628_22205 [Terriglobales bacterium]
MTVTILLILFAAVTLVLFFLRGGVGWGALDEAELSQRIRPVDLDAFRNLTDQEEEAYLRAHLPLAEFRSIERQRLRAAIDYLGGVSHNAALLLHLGQTASRNPDARIAEAGQSLVDNALRLRIYSVLAICKLCIRIVFPGAVQQPAGIVDRYQQMTERAAQLGRLQYPGRGALTSRTL